MEKLTLTPAHYGLVALVLVLVGGGAFCAGAKFGGGRIGPGDERLGRAMMMSADGAGGQWQGRGAQGAGRAGAMMNGGVVGEIIAADDKSITVKSPDGGSKIVFFGGDVKISKSTDGGVADLKAGENVVVMGTPNNDGSVTAQTIRLGDQPFMMRTGGSQGAVQGGAVQGVPNEENVDIRWEAGAAVPAR